MENEKVDTLKKLVETVGKRMHYYHKFRQELAAAREVIEMLDAAVSKNELECAASAAYAFLKEYPEE